MRQRHLQLEEDWSKLQPLRDSTQHGSWGGLMIVDTSIKVFVGQIRKTAVHSNGSPLRQLGDLNNDKMPARSESLFEWQNSYRQKKEEDGNKKRRCTWNKRALCAEDETPWETKEATSEVVVGGVCVRVCLCVCVCVCVQGAASQDESELTYWRWCLHSAYDFHYQHLSHEENSFNTRMLLAEFLKEISSMTSGRFSLWPLWLEKYKSKLGARPGQASLHCAWPLTTQICTLLQR